MSLLLFSFSMNNLIQSYKIKPNEPPLTPSKGGQSITEGAVKVGDILFSSTDKTSSKIIRKFTGGGPASHVAVISDISAGIPFVIEAISSGVRKVPLSTFIGENKYVVAFRYPNMDSNQISLMTSYLNERVDASYDMFGAFVSAFFVLNEKTVEVDYGQYKTKKTFCSKLLIEGFQTANISFLNMSGGWGTPNDLIPLTWTNNLIYVGHLKYSN